MGDINVNGEERTQRERERSGERERESKELDAHRSLRDDQQKAHDRMMREREGRNKSY